MRPSCQTLSNALEMSGKTPLTLTVGLLSKAVCMSCIHVLLIVTGQYIRKKTWKKENLEENLIERT